MLHFLWWGSYGVCNKILSQLLRIIPHAKWYPANFPSRAAGGDHPRRCLNTAPQLRQGAMLTLARSCWGVSSSMPRNTKTPSAGCISFACGIFDGGQKKGAGCMKAPALTLSRPTPGPRNCSRVFTPLFST